MRRNYVMALVLPMLVVLAIGVPMLLFAQTDGGGGAPADNLALLWVVATSIGQLVVGLLTKKSPVPNELIPHINTVLGTILYATLGGMPFKEACLAAMAAAHGATIIAETAKLAKKGGT